MNHIHIDNEQIIIIGNNEHNYWAGDSAGVLMF